MPTCFIICPIGESGSQTRIDADDLRDLIIRPALEPFGIEVVRGDHRSDAGQIDIDVIKAVQEADICIADVSIPNPNVFYEFGRRDETGKPIILLKSKNSEDLPVDVATRRYIEYDLNSRRGIIDAVTQLKNFVDPIVRTGFESNATGASLSELAEVLRRIERKIDRLETKGNDNPGVNPPPIPSNVDPIDLYKLAMRQRNIPQAEQAMEILGYRMDKMRWLDQVVESVAALGSKKAGAILIENADMFIDSSATFHEKVDYLGCLVSNLNRNDNETENMPLVERLAASLLAISGNEPDKDRIQIYNQLNRLYHGVYSNTGEMEWLEKAIDALGKALAISDMYSYLFYNLAICERKRNGPGDTQNALKHVLRSIELDGDKRDDDHLELACRILHELEDERLSDYLNELRAVNPIKAQLLAGSWG